MKRFPLLLVIALSLLISFQAGGQQAYNTAKPWTYWWWPGSAVTHADIDAQLRNMSDAGLGGVHIIPIYGVKGYEDSFLPFLSDSWLEAVNFTIERAAELNMGVDITLGTGWPYGGSWINQQNAAKQLEIRELELGRVNEININTDSIVFTEGLHHLLAVFATDGKDFIDFSPSIQTGLIRQSVDPGRWSIHYIGVKGTGQYVKRAAPGGEGLVMDYFDGPAVEHYMARFDSIFRSAENPPKPRALYHDSYEVYRADWSTRFPEKFRQLQGYSLLDHLPALLDEKNPERPYIIHDYRETLAELLLSEFTGIWTGWSHEREFLTRNQAHGSPANILDLYATAKIPETESFGCSPLTIPGLPCDPDYEEQNFGRPSPLMMKFASSPAHLLDKPLVSSETSTWLANHFKVSLKRIKPQIDELFISGINHIFYHGTTYTNQDEPFPGWLFYASTNYGQHAHFRDEFPLLNGYIEHCQAMLQEADPDHDILLYFPIHDLWTDFGGKILLHLDVHKYRRWFSATPFGKTASLLWEKGYGFDYISDQQIGGLTPGSGKGLSVDGGNEYQVLIIPPTRYIPRETLQAIDKLISKGAKIIFLDRMPENYPGLLASRESSDELQTISSGWKNLDNVMLADDLGKQLYELEMRQETLKLQGLDFIRKKNAEGRLYFISNLGHTFFRDSIKLSTGQSYLQLSDPMTGQSGYLETADEFELYLPPGKSIFIQTLSGEPDMEAWQEFIPGSSMPIKGPWEVEFISGNTEGLQSSYPVELLNSWTEWDDESLGFFCGKGKYTTSFQLKDPRSGEGNYKLIFKEICETAEVIVNGTSCGTIWALPYEIGIPAHLLKEKNTLEVIVQNLSANRIRKVDKEHPEWKKFYDINIVDIQYEPFDASDWDPMPSGLIGPVTLIMGR